MGSVILWDTQNRRDFYMDILAWQKAADLWVTPSPQNRILSNFVRSFHEPQFEVYTLYTPILDTQWLKSGICSAGSWVLSRVLQTPLAVAEASSATTLTDGTARARGHLRSPFPCMTSSRPFLLQLSLRKVPFTFEELCHWEWPEWVKRDGSTKKKTPEKRNRKS